jgi:uncharacterized protein (DUF433 family)
MEKRNMTLPDFLTQDANGWIHTTGHRIGLEHLTYYYNEGYSPEMLACEYPTLGLAVIYKIFAFYLENRADVDAYVLKCDEELEKHKRAAKKGPSLEELRQRLEAVSRAGGR